MSATWTKAAVGDHQSARVEGGEVRTYSYLNNGERRWVWYFAPDVVQGECETLDAAKACAIAAATEAGK